MQWTYDLRGLDVLAWASRAAADLAAHRAAEDCVMLLVDSEAGREVALLREALGAEGYAVRETAVLGVPALLLGAPPRARNGGEAR